MEARRTPPSEPDLYREATYEEDTNTNEFSMHSSVNDTFLKIINICFEEEIESSSSISRLASEAERRVKEFKKMKEKEKKELERSVVSLKEENRDMHNLLRVALKGNHKSSPEQQKSSVVWPLLDLFGFTTTSAAAAAEEESGILLNLQRTRKETESAAQGREDLGSAVESVMMNLRLQIMQLKSSLGESRSEAERLQCLAGKQAEEIAENTTCIKELEYRERILAQNVADLLRDVKETETEATRWKEAYEFEVEAAKKEIGERDRMINILKREVEKTKGALQVSNGKLKLKEQVAGAAMAAHAAAERSLQLADSRTSGLRRQIEELMRQLEETEKRNQKHCKVWHVCFPWTSFMIDPLHNANNTRTRRRMVPEMQSLLH